MEDFSSIKLSSSVVKLAACLEKIYNKIVEAKEKQVAENQIKEIEFLKTQCKHEHMQLSLMSCQTLVRLVDEGVLDANSVQNTLLSMLTNAGPTHFAIITESILGLQLLGLKRKTALLKDKQSYQCPYGLKTQLHPLISLLQHTSANMHDVSNKIIGICQHHDKNIRNYSIEFLRPVFLYVLCNPQTLQDVKPIWTCLLGLSQDQPEARALMQELLSWSKFNNASTCLCTSILVIEAIDYFTQQSDHAQAIDLCIYQALLVKQLAHFGIDPRPSLQCLLRVLHATREHTRNHYHVLLVLLAECLHVLSPFYLADLLRIIVFVVVQERCGHEYILNMCLDGIIQWMSQTAFIPAEGLALAHQIVQRVLDQQKPPQDGNEDFPTRICTKELQPAHMRNYHPDIAVAFDLAILVESFDASENKDVFAFVDALNVKANSAFCQRLHLFLRALFLSREPPVDCWFKIYEVILQIIKANESIAYDFLMTYIFKLAHEHNPELQLELLRGLASFAVSKDNVPMILNTIRNLSNDNGTFCVDLYLRLWRVETRTYPFLLKQIAQPLPENDKRWELQIARTHAMREICQEKPTLHGSELLPHLSNTLNSCTDEAGDLATSLALDAIYALCDSHTVNIASTWQALGSKFRNEQRPQTLKSLYHLFGLVPLLQTPTLEYEKLADDALEQLWQAVSRPNTDATQVRNALVALKSYEPGNTLSLRHIPPQFRFEITGGTVGSGPMAAVPGAREVVNLQQEESVPGEVWVQLLQKIRPECGDAAADLVAHYISNEISGFRSGVYRLPEGKPEPRKLVGLFATSPLRAVTNYLVNQSRFGDYVPEPYAVTYALRALSKRFTKPIPPMDWSCLTSFFHLSFDARKYCIMIAKNQALHSGTARRLLENFLADFEPNCFEEDLLLLFSLLPEIGNSVSLQVLKTFAEKVAVYCFKESQLNDFAEGCLFEKFLDSVRYIYSDKCEIPEVLDVFTLIVERYMDSMNLDSRLFERYTEVVSVLHPNAIDGLTTPANWWETPAGKLKKATIIRCYLVLYNDKLPNPLKWLTPIIDAYERRVEERPFFYRHLATTLYAFGSDEHSSNWISEIFLEIQMLLAEASNKEKLNRALYLLDIFILAVDVLSGCAVLLGSVDVVATDGKERFALFPESLQYLCDHIFWKDQEAKIYEFLYNLYKHAAIPLAYAAIFKEAIICSRNKPYFDNKGVWTKYVGLRK